MREEVDAAYVVAMLKQAKVPRAGCGADGDIEQRQLRAAEAAKFAPEGMYSRYADLMHQSCRFPLASRSSKPANVFPRVEPITVDVEQQEAHCFHFFLPHLL